MRIISLIVLTLLVTSCSTTDRVPVGRIKHRYHCPSKSLKTFVIEEGTDKHKDELALIKLDCWISNESNDLSKPLSADQTNYVDKIIGVAVSAYGWIKFW